MQKHPSLCFHGKLTSKLPFFLLAATSIQGGCIGWWLPPTSELPLDVVIKPDGTVLLSTDFGNLLATTNQGDTWKPLFSFDEVSSLFSGSIDELMISPDGTIWGVYSAPAGRRFLTIIPSKGISVSCDDGQSFDVIGSDVIEDDYGLELVEQENTFPLILSPNGQLYEASGEQECPDALEELGIPNPVGSVGSAAVCGGTIFQTGGARIFSSTDRGQSWVLETDFFRGLVRLACEGDEVWSFSHHDHKVFKRDADSSEWTEVGQFDFEGETIDQLNLLLRSGQLFAVVKSEFREVKILAMSNDGSVREFPSPRVDEGEYDFDFEIAPDGVFWLTTTRAVYRDDANEVWTKVWP